MTLSDIVRFSVCFLPDEFIWIDGDKMEAWLMRGDFVILWFKLI
jgi:hypothetical protein